MILEPAVWLPIQLVATLFMAGLIWFVQIVHYPLMGKVGERRTASYATDHANRTTFVVAPPMLLELAAATLFVWEQPPGVSFELAACGFGLVFLVWVATAVFSIPCHSRLQRSFDSGAHRRLVRTNWIRTIGWTARVPIVVLMLYRFLENTQVPG